MSRPATGPKHNQKFLNIVSFNNKLQMTNLKIRNVFVLIIWILTFVLVSNFVQNSNL